MASASDIDIVLLAAGGARRYGSAKQLALLDGTSLVRRAAQAALATGARLTVVTGAYADGVAAQLSGLPLALAHNSAWQQGMGSSIACGARHVMAASPHSRALIVCLADQPRVDGSDLDRLIAESQRDPRSIVAADHGTTLGPPCLFPKAFYAELAALDGTQGARRLLDSHADRVRRIAMPDAGIDVDTVDDLRRLSSRSA